MKINKQKIFSLLASIALMAWPLASGALTYVTTSQSSQVSGNLPYATGSLVNDGGTIYFISGNTKVPFTNWPAFVGLGYSIKNVVNGDLSGYTPAASYMITSANAAHPWGSWLVNNGTVYYSTQSGLIGVPSAEVFLQNGGNWNQVVKANSYDLAALSGSQILTSNDSRVTATFTCPANADCANLPTPTPTATPTEAPTPTPNSTLSTLTINSLSPSSGSIGALVTITGSGFMPSGNTVNFSSGAIPNLSSSDGSTLSFTVPSVLNPACYFTTPQCLVASIVLANGSYNVSVSNANGTSNIQTFTVTFTCPSTAMCVPTPTPTPTPSPASAAPIINYLSPTSGAIAAQVTVIGSGFTATGNIVNFGSGVIGNISSSNGTSLSFSVPDHLAPPCSLSATPCPYAFTPTTAGQYNVSLSNANGSSNSQPFNVTSSNCLNTAMCASIISITSPAGGEQWASSSTQSITWTAPSSVTSLSITLNYQGNGCVSTNNGGSYSITCDGQLPAPSTITANVPNTGSFSWYIDPSKFYSMPVTITIKDNGSSGLTTTSNKFTIH